MGGNNSKQDIRKKREYTSQSISTELDNSSSSIYSNHEELRNETQQECMACSFTSSSKPNWLKFFHSKCDKMIKNNIPWAQDGKGITELKGKKDYRGEYEQCFQENMKKIRKIVSSRPSMNANSVKYNNQNMHNILGDLNQITNPSQLNKKGIQKSKGDLSQKTEHQYSQKRSDKQFSSSHFASNNDNDFYSVKSELLSNPTPLNQNVVDNDKFKKSGRLEDHSHYMSCKSNYQKTDEINNSELMNVQYNNNQIDQNNSYPSYMLENEFQGLRAGNVTVMKMNNSENERKNLEFYFECTILISQHLDDPNFTLYQIRQIFISSFFQRYSEQIKVHREQLVSKKNEENIRQKPSNNNQNNDLSQKGKIDISHQMNQSNQNLAQNQNTNYIYSNVSIQRFCSAEKFSPLQEAFKIYKNAIREFQYFTKIYMEIIKQYYDIHYKKNKQMNQGLKDLFSYQNFQNFVITKLFQNEKIPKILIELIKLVTPNDKELINQVDPHKLTPQMFGIPNHLSLDDETRKMLGCSPHYNSQDGFGSIKEELDDFEFIQQSNSNQQQKNISNQNQKKQYLDEQQNNSKNFNQQINKFQGEFNLQANPSDLNAINSDQYSRKTSSYTESIESHPTSKFNSHQKYIIPPRNIKQEVQVKNDEEDNEIGVSEEDQDIIFELKITNKAKSQFTQLYQQNDQLRGNSNIFNSSSQLKQEINANGFNTHIKIPNPYQMCIDYIEQMINNTTPTGKFKSIILACESIEKCIKEFYKQNGRTFSQTLDQESIISILTFIISQTGFNNLEAHCKFVQSFYKNPSKRMKLKYYLIAFEVSVRNMQELYYTLSQQQKQQQSMNNSQQIDTAHDTSFNSNKSAQSIFKKNLNKKLAETFGEDNSQAHQLMNITGKNSFLKQTLAETKF